jgi:hypothetical protein
MYLKKSLRMFRRFEALHPTLSLAGRVMRVLCSVVDVSHLPMSDSRQGYFLCGTVVSKLLRNDDPRPASIGLQQLAKETDRLFHCAELWTGAG